MSGAVRAIPAHVPPELVFDLDMWNLPAGFQDPTQYWLTARDKGAPPIFYTPHWGGHWVAHGYHEALEAYRDADFFTSFPNGIPARAGGAAKLIPVEIDPPEHQKYRLVLAPAFSPVAVRKLQGQIRNRVTALIAAVEGAGGCDFVEVVSGRLPTSIFIDLMGMPAADFDVIMEKEHAFLRGPTEEARKAGADAIFDYIVRFIDAEAAEPHDNMAGVLLAARDAAGEPWTREEIYNTAFLLYVAGLDTVTNMMGFIWRYLAETPAARAYVAANIESVDSFVDELIRLSVPAFNARRVRRDGAWKGVQMKAGEALLCAPMVANRDASVFPDPDRFDPGRENARQNLSFGSGPHRCVGSHLARQEILISLQAWFSRIPDFALAPEADLKPYLGNISGYGALPLVWRSEGRR